MVRRIVLIPCLAGAALAQAQAADNLDLQFHGFASQGYFLTRDNAMFTPESQDKGTFEFNEAALNVMATPVERLRVGIQIFAQDQGDNYNNKLQIDWAYGDYSFPTYGALNVGVTAGRLKMNHGLYNDYRDLDMTRTSVFLPMAVYNPRLRDYLLSVNGAGVHGSLDGGGLGSLDLTAYIGGQSPDPHEGTLHDIFTDLGVDLNTLHIEAVDGANLTWNAPVDGLRFKYSLFNARGIDASGTVNTGTALPFIPGSTARLVIDNLWDNIFSVEYQRENLTFAAEAEYWYLKGDLRGNVGIPFSIPTYQVLRSCYLSAAWRFLPRWEAQGIWQWNESDPVTQPQQKFYGLTAALRFDPIEHWLIKAEYTWMHGTGLLRLAEQPDGRFDPTWGYLAIKTTFDF